jgi:hypothetical protein
MSIIWYILDEIHQSMWSDPAKGSMGSRMKTSGLQFRSLPKKLQALIIILFTAAIIILCWSVSTLLHSPQDVRWIVIALLAIITVPFAVFLPSTGTMLLLGDTYLMAIAIMYGSATCVIATAFYALVAVVLFRFLGASASVFNFSLIVCDAFLYSSAYHIAKPSGIALTALVLAVVSFLFSSVIAAAAVSWQQHDSFHLKRWAKSSLPLSINTLLAAACAVFIAATYRTNAWSPLAAAPVIWIIWTWTKAYKSRLMRKAALEESL